METLDKPIWLCWSSEFRHAISKWVGDIVNNGFARGDMLAFYYRHVDNNRIADNWLGAAIVEKWLIRSDYPDPSLTHRACGIFGQTPKSVRSGQYSCNLFFTYREGVCFSDLQSKIIEISY